MFFVLRHVRHHKTLFLKSLFATWWYRFTATSDVNQRALKLPSISYACFLTGQIFIYPSPGSQFLLRPRSGPISARKWKVAGKCLKRFSETPRLKLTTGEGFWKALLCQKTRVGDGGELERTLVDVTGTGKTVPSCLVSSGFLCSKVA